jgi:hypothetical protein
MSKALMHDNEYKLCIYHKAAWVGRMPITQPLYTTRHTGIPRAVGIFSIFTLYLANLYGCHICWI